MKRDDIQPSSEAALTDHKSKLAAFNARIGEYDTRIAATQSDRTAVDELRAKLADLKAKQRVAAAASYLGEAPPAFLVDNKMIADAERELRDAEARCDAADAAREVLMRRRDAVAAEANGEAARGKALRYAVLRDRIDAELAGLRDAFRAYIEAYARTAAACVAANSFADPPGGRPLIGVMNYGVTMRPDLPDIALPPLSGGDAARSLALASWEIDVLPLTLAAKIEFMEAVE